MTTWFYAEINDHGVVVFSTAIRARTLAAARRALQRKFPGATILSVSR